MIFYCQKLYFPHVFFFFSFFFLPFPSLSPNPLITEQYTGLIKCVYQQFDLAVLQTSQKCTIQEGVTDRQTDGETLVLRCEEGSKKKLSDIIPDALLTVLDMRTLQSCATQLHHVMSVRCLIGWSPVRYWPLLSQVGKFLPLRPSSRDLRPKSQPWVTNFILENNIPASRLNSQPQGSIPSLKAQFLASRPKSWP